MPFDSEAVEAIRKSGRWWERPWWRDSVYAAEFKLQSAQIEAAFDVLREQFNEAWLKKQADRRHPMLQELFGATGLIPFIFLYKVGNGLRILKQAGLLGDLAGRLKDSGQFDGAHAELNALAHWIEAGVKVEKDVPSGNGNRNCDWKVTDGSAVIYGDVKCIELSPINKKRQSFDLPPSEREPIPYDLAAEGDKTMDVVEEAASQIPASGPGLFMVSGSGSAAALPFSVAAGRRMVERFKMQGCPCGHIAGVLVVRTFLYPEHGLVQHVVFVRNPVGPAVSMNLLRRGFPDVIVWEDKDEDEEDGNLLSHGPETIS